METEPPRIAESGNTQHQRRKHERNHDHEKKTEEDLPDRTRQVIRYPLCGRASTPEKTGCQPGNGADQQSDQDLRVEWNLGHGPMQASAVPYSDGRTV